MRAVPSAVGSFAAALACALLCGCGASSGNAVAKAAAASLHGGNADIRFTASSTLNGSTAHVLGSGDSRGAPQAAQLNLQFRSPQSNGTIRELLRGTTIYMISPLFRATIPEGKAWVKIDLGRAGRSSRIDLGSISATTPNDILRLLASTKAAKKIDSPVVDGVKTTRYRATIDPEQVPRAPGVRVVYHPVEVWIDHDGLVRRANVTFASGSASHGNVTVDYARTGRRLHLDLPDASVVFDATAQSTERKAKDSSATP